MSIPQRIFNLLLMDGPLDLRTAGINLGEWATNDGRGVLVENRLLRFDPVEGKHSLGPGLGLVLAFSVGGEHVVAGLVDAGGVVHHVREAEPTRSQLNVGPDAVAERLRKVAGESIAAGLKDDALVVKGAQGGRELRLIGASAAWPLQLDRDTKFLNANLGAVWKDKTAREHLSEALGLPLDRCHALNDSNAGALVAAFEQPYDERVGAVLCVHLSAGIGLGTVQMPIRRPERKPFITSNLVAGRQGLAGEIGHCRIDDGVVGSMNAQLEEDHAQNIVNSLKTLMPTRRCACGRQGHLEAVFGSDALLARLGRAESKGPQLPAIRDLQQIAENGDVNVRRAFQDVGTGVGSLLAGVAFALDPTAIRITGSVANEHVCRGIRERLRMRDASRIPVGLLSERPEDGPPALRGGALSVLRAGIYRSFFESCSYRGKTGGALDDWTGWDMPQEGAQSGKLKHRTGASWEYAPFRVDARWLRTRKWS